MSTSIPILEPGQHDIDYLISIGIAQCRHLLLNNHEETHGLL